MRVPGIKSGDDIERIGPRLSDHRRPLKETQRAPGHRRDLHGWRLQRAIPARAAGARSCAIGDTEQRELNPAAKPKTTNNRMELMAAIAGARGPEARRARCTIHDRFSTYVKDGITRLDRTAGRSNGWKHLGQEAGQERRALETARGGARAAQGHVEMGQGPRRPSRKRARRSARPRRDETLPIVCRDR